MYMKKCISNNNNTICIISCLISGNIFQRHLITAAKPEEIFKRNLIYYNIVITATYSDEQLKKKRNTIFPRSKNINNKIIV